MYRSLILAASTAAFFAAGAAPAQKFVRPRPRPPVDNSVASVGRTPMTATAEDAQSQAQTQAQPQAAAPAASGAPAGTPQTGAPLTTVEPGLNGAEPKPAPTTTIAQALPTLPAHATLNKLVAATDLGATLAGPGPFTVLAPVDEAFARMPAGALDTLLAPANKATLTKIIQYHVIPGKLTAEAIKAQITAGGGTAKLTTANGEQLTASIENGNVLLTDVNGQKSYVTTPDLEQTNGVVHVTNGVVFPKLG